MNPETIEYLVGGKRFTDFKGYLFDKLIFGSYILLLLFTFLIIFLVNGSDRSNHLYYKCDSSFDQGSICHNPFYNNYPICESVWIGACDQKTVSDGFEFGEPAPWIVRSWGLFVILGLFFAFIINHLRWNYV